MIVPTVMAPAVHSVSQDTLILVVLAARNVTFTANSAMTVNVIAALTMIVLRIFALMPTVLQLAALEM